MSRFRVVGATAAAVLAASSCGWFGGSPAADATPGTAAAPATAPRPAGPPDEAARRFLAAWSAGDDAGAAALTDAPDAAAPVLAGLRAQLPVAGIQAEARPAPGRAEQVPFTVNVALADVGTWTYPSTLTVVADKGQWRVAWAPSVIHPRLTAGATFKLAETPARAGATTVLDRHGRPLVGGEHPSLAPSILPAILRTAPPIPGKPGRVVQLVERNGGVVTLEQVTAAEAGGGTPSTLDAGIQSAAQQALGAVPNLGAAVVVLQASTGHILAIASNPPASKLATHAGRPPGSAFKVVVASALLAAGDTPETPVPCDATYTIPQGRTFQNEAASDTNPGADLAFDFAVSCNTAFVARGRELLNPPQRLFDHAAAVYGLTGTWDIGLGEPRAYWHLPNPGGNRDLWGEDLIGQGNLTVEPLAMASVAATAATGTFRQPILVPHARPVAARAGAPSQSLRRMMQGVVSRGTATSLRGVADGAKTGTADVSGGNVNWMIAYRGDYAVACLVQGFDRSRGNDTAGPVVAQVLRAL